MVPHGVRIDSQLIEQKFNFRHFKLRKVQNSFKITRKTYEQCAESVIKKTKYFYILKIN